MLLAQRINKRAAKGNDAISYSEFMFLRTFTDDAWKVLRLGVMMSLSFDFFLYSYCLGPLMTNTPRAWSSWPSSFDTSKDRETRESALIQRRRTSLINILNQLETDTNLEGASDMITKAQIAVDAVLRALRCKNAEQVINEVPEFLFTESKTLKMSKERPHLKGCSGTILKSIVNILGSDGLPNIFLINRLNANEVSNCLDKVCRMITLRSKINYISYTDLRFLCSILQLAKSDDMLLALGTKALSDTEVKVLK